MRNHFFLITILITAVAGSAGAQDATDHKQIQILTELRQLRTLIETRLSVQPEAQTLPGSHPQIQTRTVNFNIGNSPFLGSEDGVDGELVIGAEPYGLFDKKLRELSQ